MRVAPGFALVLVLVGCGGGDGGDGGDPPVSGGQATFADDAGANKKFSGTAALEETVAGHLPNNFGGELGQLIFNLGTIDDAAWIDIIFAEPVEAGTRTVVSTQPSQLGAGEAMIEYDEYGAGRAWTSQSGTLTIVRADIPVVEVMLDGVAMMPTMGDATGTFTLALSATATEYDANQ
jgi:hypothetical protein